MFSALSLNSTLHILDVRNGVKYYNVPIDSVSPIRPMYPTYTAGVSNGLNMGSVVDIAVTIDGKRKEFTNVSAIGNVSTSDLYIIADNKEAIVSLVDSILLNSTTAVSEDTINKHNTNIADCKEILKKLNPTFAKEEAMGTAIASLTERVNTMLGEFGDIKGNVQQILGILTNAENRKTL